MTQTVELSPFFERAETSRDGFPAESYVAGFREPNGATIGVEITLPAEIGGADRADRRAACRSAWRRTGGWCWTPRGSATRRWRRRAPPVGCVSKPSKSLVAGCLDPELLAGEDDAVGDLTSLRAQLVRALAQLDGTLERLKQAIAELRPASSGVAAERHRPARPCPAHGGGRPDRSSGCRSCRALPTRRKAWSRTETDAAAPARQRPPRRVGGPRVRHGPPVDGDDRAMAADDVAGAGRRPA